MKQSEGYFFLALGEKYINECYNLALTIKKQNDIRPISLLIHERDLKYCKEKQIFDSFVFFEPDENCEIWKLCNNYFEKYCLYPRLHLNKYIPYDISITVDSDVLCQYSPEYIWKELSTKDFPVQMVGKKYDINWHFGTINEVIESYGKHIPHVHGGFFYIRKNEQKTKDFFDYCKSLVFIYDKLKCKRLYANGMVDEILFGISHANFNIFPIEFEEFSIMTFNYTPEITIPSCLQTEGNKRVILKFPIPFVHMFDKIDGSNYKHLLKKIMT